jgi:hypothetical protein
VAQVPVAQVPVAEVPVAEGKAAPLAATVTVIPAAPARLDPGERNGVLVVIRGGKFSAGERTGADDYRVWSKQAA